MEDPVPFLLELRLAEDRLPGLADDVVAGTVLIDDHQPQHFDRASSAEQGKNERLDDAHGAADGAGIPP